MNRFLAVIGVVLSPIAHADAQMPPAAEQHDIEQSLFGRAGFQAIAEVAREGREVRRLLLKGPYGRLVGPGVELERFDDGRVTLRLQYVGWSSNPVAVDPAAWDELEGQDPSVFGVSGIDPSLTGSRLSQAPAPCHGWTASLETDDQGKADWAQCSGNNTPAYRYAAVIAAIAVETKPDCFLDKADPFWSFDGCFGHAASFQDPETEGTVSGMRQAFDGAQGPDRLAEAQRALTTAELSSASKAWSDARAAITRFKETRDLLHERLLSLTRFAADADDASSADSAKLAHLIQTWSRVLKAQDASYADMLQRLSLTEPTLKSQ